MTPNQEKFDAVKFATSNEMLLAYGLLGSITAIKIARNPELQKRFESFLTKIGSTLKGVGTAKLGELAAYTGVALIGYEAFQDWKGAVFGLVSLKLASSPGGTPPVSQVSGLIGLASLGVASFVGVPGLTDLAEETIKPVMPGGYVPTEIYGWKQACEVCCVELLGEEALGKIRGYLYGYRGRSLDQIADMLIQDGYRDIVECANAKTELKVGFSYTTCECDVNGDGVVNILDITQLFENGLIYKAEYCSKHHFGKKCVKKE